MASVQHFVEDAEQIVREILRRHELAESEKSKEYKAALIIQRFFRGYYQRKYLKFINKNAIIVQKIARGFLARLRHRKIVEEHTKQMIAKTYHLMATIIQKTWRGHFVRSYVFSYYKLQKWIQHVHTQNYEMRYKMNEFRMKTHEKFRDVLEEESKQWILFIIFKLHHLLRTASCKGIYSSKLLNPHLSKVEELLKTLKYTQYMKSVRKEYLDMVKNKKPRKIILKGRLSRCERYWNMKNLDDYCAVFKVRENGDNRELPGTRFVLSTRLDEPTNTDFLGPYTEAIRNVVRDIDKTRNISRAEFKRFAKHAVHFSNYIDYYIDMWDRMICEEHYIPNPFAVKPERKLQVPPLKDTGFNVQMSH